MRHTFASHLLQAGLFIQEVAAALGHSTTYVTDRYAHHAPARDRRITGVIDERLDTGGASRIRDGHGRVLDALRRTGILPAGLPGPRLKVI